MNILLLGSGGRECALARKLRQSQSLSNLYIAPGNGGTLEYGKNLAIAATDFTTIENFCIENAIDMLICGPEQPAVKGIWDYFQKEELKHIQVVAPSQKSAMLEGSKAFAKEFMTKNKIPTALKEREFYEFVLLYLKASQREPKKKIITLWAVKNLPKCCIPNC